MKPVYVKIVSMLKMMHYFLSRTVFDSLKGVDNTPSEEFDDVKYIFSVFSDKPSM